ncbi:MAG TPA: Dabb family protein [Phnomibacter sp.]|nr:Dabb family protein [Phnomibacter sp.]
MKNALLVLVLVYALSGCVLSTQKVEPHQTPAVIHQVFFWLKEPGNAEHISQLKEGLYSMKEIPQVKQLHIGVPASTEVRDVIDNTWQVSETMYFNSVEDQDAYQVHPLHQAFIEKYGHLWQRVVVYDVTIEAQN